MLSAAAKEEADRAVDVLGHHEQDRAAGDGGILGHADFLLPGGFEVVLDKTRGMSAQAPAPRQARARGEDEEEGDGEGDGETEEQESAPAAGWVSSIGMSTSTWHPDFVDIREDRVVLFGSVGPSMQEFVYRIKATNKGTYAVPPAYAESMYDRAIRARTLPGVMVVLDKKKDEKQEVKVK